MANAVIDRFVTAMEAMQDALAMAQARADRAENQRDELAAALRDIALSATTPRSRAALESLEQLP